MENEKKIQPTEEDEKIVKTVEELAEEQKKSEEDESKKEGKADFEKDAEVVPSGKYNAALRKQRELETELRELRLAKEEKQDKPEKKVVKNKEEEDDDDFFDDEEEDFKSKENIIEPISRELRELRERVDARDADDKKKQRTAFFKAHPQYLSDPEKWAALLDEMDNSLNPNSKDSYFKQLSKAHKLIDDGPIDNSTIERKRAEMASDLNGKGDIAKKSDAPAVDDRSMRLAQKMPKGYEINKK